MIRWNSEDAEAVAAQLLARVRQGLKEGNTMGVVVCLIEQDADGERTYSPAFSTLPVEISQWAAMRIHRRVLEVNES